MTLIPRSDAKRVYALLSSLPAVSFYLVLLAYMYFGDLKTLGDAVLLLFFIVETGVLTILLTKLKVAWWLRRKRFVLGRFAVIVFSMLASMLVVLLLVLI